jgi:hypothetical protein
VTHDWDALCTEWVGSSEPVDRFCKTRGVSTATLYQKLRDKKMWRYSHNKGGRQVPVKEVEKHKMIDAFVTGKSMTTISADTGRSLWTVRKVLDEAGIRPDTRLLGGEELSRGPRCEGYPLYCIDCSCPVPCKDWRCKQCKKRDLCLCQHEHLRAEDWRKWFLVWCGVEARNARSTARCRILCPMPREVQL